MRTAALSIVIGLVLAQSRAEGGSEDASGRIAQARRLAQASDHEAAIAILEDALIEAGEGDRSTIVGMLKRSYMVMAGRADSGGRPGDADRYRDNLEILEKAPRGSKAPAAAKPAEVPAREAPARPSDRESTPANPIPERIAPQAAAAASLPPLEAAPPVLAEPPRLGPPTAPTAPEARAAVKNPVDRPAAAESPNVDLAEADRLFKSRRFIPAGQRYAALARADRLPKSRVDHWAYCRWVAVVAAINAQPRNTREWDAVEAEVASIQKLAPANWYGEYLRGKVAEIRGGKARTGDNLVVRAAEPEEARPSRLKRLFGRAESPANPPAEPASQAAVPEPPLALPVDTGGTPPPAKPEKSASDAWEILETPNFRIHHRDPALATKAGEAAEATRDQQGRIWRPDSPPNPWSPRCEIYLYADGQQFARATGQPESSPGFSTMSSNGVRVVGRRVNLRADHPQLLTAILPHEVTHVVLADLFTTTQIPRWADEGVAVLAEPPAERESRAADLEKPLESGRVFNLGKLMTMDYPAPQDWAVYYAQSVSLTRFLVERGRPAQFIEFVKRAHDDGVEPALRELYQLNGLADLEARWLADVRRRFAARTPPPGDDQAQTLRR